MKTPFDYKWSSALALRGEFGINRFEVDEKWSAIRMRMSQNPQLICAVEDPEELTHVRELLRRDLPLGSSEFIESLERETGRTLSPRPVGRPRHNGTR